MIVEQWKTSNVSDNMALSDFWVFAMLKCHLGKECYGTDNEVQCAVNSFFRKQATEFYVAGISRLIF